MNRWNFILLAALPLALLWPLASWARAPGAAVRDACGATGTNIRWPTGLLHLVVFACCVFVLGRIDISGADLDHGGLATIAYTAGRGVLAFFVLGICFTLGALLLRWWLGKPPRDALSNPPRWIACLFLGASALGVIGTGIGLAGGLRLPLVLALVLPLVFLAPSQLGPAFDSIPQTIRAAAARLAFPGLALHIFMAWYLLILLIVALVWKGLYPANAEADVWNHYVHYFREVLQTGSVGPGENWGHFWNSKAAGLTHLVGVLSDEFSAQLVSWSLAVMTALIVVDMLGTALRSTAWALFGAGVFMCGVLADPSIGAFLRHHMAITALVGYWVWAAWRILSPDLAHREAVIAASLVVAFYTGLYPTQIAPLFVAFIGTLLAAAIMLRRRRSDAWPLAWLLFALVAGMLTEFLINYAAAGIASFVSVRLFWPFSDQEKFGRLIGDSGILYYLFANNDNRPPGGTLEWFVRLFRARHFAPFLTGALVIATVAVFSLARRANRGGALRPPMLVPVAVTGAFVLVSLIPPLVFRNEALMRAYLFLNFLVPVFVLLILKPITDACRENSFKRIWVGVLLVAASLTLIWQGLRPHNASIGTSWSFAKGRLSMAEALRLTADTYSEPERFAFLQTVRRGIGPKPRIFTFTYAPGPGDGFPGPGMMSEPTYSLGPRYADMIFGEPDLAARLLQARGVDYFHISRDGALFTGLAFSRLFRADNLDRHFRLAYREGGQFMLTWRRPGDAVPLPRDLVESLELRQKAVLLYPFSGLFPVELKARVDTALAQRGYLDPAHPVHPTHPAAAGGPVAADLAGIVDGLLRTRMTPDALLPENRSSLEGALGTLAGKLKGTVPAMIDTHRAKLLAGPDPRRGLAERLAREVTAELVTATQIVVMNACIPRFGRPYCDLLTLRDERVPFGAIYRSRAAVSNMLRLDFTDAVPKQAGAESPEENRKDP